MVKKKLELLGNIPNVLSFPENTIEAFKINEEEKEFFVSTVTMFSRKAKSHMTFSSVRKYIGNGFSNIDLVRMSKYPLPTVYNDNTKKILLNVSALGRRTISSVEPRDLYSLVVNGHVYTHLLFSSFSSSNATLVSEFMSAIFLKTFSRRYGLSGSFFELIPELRFLVSIYVLISFFGMDPKLAYRKAILTSKYELDKTKINLETYDFTSIKELVKVLNESGTLPGLNTYTFISTMIRSFQVINLPLFEDLARFCASVYTSTINGNSITTPRLQSYNQEIYKQLVVAIERAI